MTGTSTLNVRAAHTAAPLTHLPIATPAVCPRVCSPCRSANTCCNLGGCFYTIPLSAASPSGRHTDPRARPGPRPQRMILTIWALSTVRCWIAFDPYPQGILVRYSSASSALYSFARFNIDTSWSCPPPALSFCPPLQLMDQIARRAAQAAGSNTSDVA